MKILMLSRLLSLLPFRYWQRWDNGNVAVSVDNYWRTNEYEIDFRSRLGQYLKESFGGAVNLLEIGCGSGLIYETLLANGIVTSQSYTGGDISRNMLRIARERYPEAVFKTLDILDLPLNDGSVDNVLSVHVLQHLPDHQKAVRELLRITRRHLCIVTWYNMTDKDELAFGMTEYENLRFYNNLYSLSKFIRFVCNAAGKSLVALSIDWIDHNTWAVFVTKRDKWPKSIDMALTGSTEAIDGTSRYKETAGKTTSLKL